MTDTVVVVRAPAAVVAVASPAIGPTGPAGPAGPPGPSGSNYLDLDTWGRVVVDGGIPALSNGA